MARARELQIVRILECGLSADTSGFEQAKVFQLLYCWSCVEVRAQLRMFLEIGNAYSNDEVDLNQFFFLNQQIKLLK